MRTKTEKTILRRLKLLSPSSRGLHFEIMSDEILQWANKRGYKTTTNKDNSGILWSPFHNGEHHA